MGDRRVINDHNTGHRTPPLPQTQSKPAPAAAVQEAAGAHQTAPRDLQVGHHSPSRWHGCRRAPDRRPRPASSRSGGLHLRQRAERAAFSPRCGRTPEKWPKGDLRGTKITTRSAARQQAACPPRAARRRSPRPALEGLCRPVAAVAPPGGRVGRSYDVTYSDPPLRFSFFVPNQRDLGGASAPLGGAACAPGAARRRGPRADGPSRGAQPVEVAPARCARPPASFSARSRTVRRKSRQSPVHPEFCRFS